MIPNLPSAQDLTANGAAVEFSYDFAAPDTSHVHVAINGTELTSGFTVSSTSEGNGFVILSEPPVSGSTVTVWRETPMEQTQAFGTGSSFFPKQVEKALDNVTMMMQEIRGGKVAGGGVPYANSAGFASSAGALTSEYKAALIGSAVGSVDVSGSSVAYATTAGGLTTSAMEEVASAAAGFVTVGGGTSDSAGYATEAGYASSAGGLTEEAASSAWVNSAASAGVASGLTSAATSAIVSAAVASAGGASTDDYNGPFKVSIDSGGTVTVTGGTAVTTTNTRDKTVGYAYGLEGGQGHKVNFESKSLTIPGSSGTVYAFGFFGSGAAPVYDIGIAYSSDTIFNMVSSSTLSSHFLVSSGGSVAYQSRPGQFMVPLAIVHSQTRANGGVWVEQLQYGNIFLPQYKRETAVSDGITVDSNGAFVLQHATGSNYGGVKLVLSGIPLSGYGYDDPTRTFVPSADTVYVFVSNYVSQNGGGSGGTSTIVYSGGTASYASSAGGLTSDAFNDVVASAAASAGGTSTVVYSGGTASYASSAGGLTSDAFNDIVASAAASAGGSGELTVATSAAWIATPTSSGSATYSHDYTTSNSAYTALSSGGSAVNGGVTLLGKIDDDPSFSSLNAFAVPTAQAVLNNMTATFKNPNGNILTVTGESSGTSAVGISAVTNGIPAAWRGRVRTQEGFSLAAIVNVIDSRYGGSDGLNSFAVPTINAVVSHVSGAVASAAGAAGYAGPFAVTASGSTITVAGGRMYLGGVEYTVASATLTSSNGTVYYYTYYSGGTYYSGCSLAASASALAAVIRGSQGYYTALANVSGGTVTQCHYGDIRIDGRVA